MKDMADYDNLTDINPKIPLGKKIFIFLLILLIALIIIVVTRIIFV